METSGTIFFSKQSERERLIHGIINDVYNALSEKGYNPTSQMVGYIMSGDPTYITSHNSARSKVMKVERDEIVEELLENYIETVLAGDAYDGQPGEYDEFEDFGEFDEFPPEGVGR